MNIWPISTIPSHIRQAAFHAALTLDTARTNQTLIQHVALAYELTILDHLNVFNDDPLTRQQCVSAGQIAFRLTYHLPPPETDLERAFWVLERSALESLGGPSALLAQWYRAYPALIAPCTSDSSLHSALHTLFHVWVTFFRQQEPDSIRSLPELLQSLEAHQAALQQEIRSSGNQTRGNLYFLCSLLAWANATQLIGCSFLHQQPCDLAELDRYFGAAIQASPMLQEVKLRWLQAASRGILKPITGRRAR